MRGTPPAAISVSHPTAAAVAAGLLLLSIATPSGAAYLLSPDFVCAPTDKVCVIDTPWTVLEGEVLDFGRRRVVVRGDGRLEGSLTLLCGSFDVDVPGSWMAAEKGGKVAVTARRGCSGDPSFPCLSDSDCAAPDRGTCDSGNASITIFGATGGQSAWLRLEAADSVTIAGPVDVSAPPVADYFESYAGLVDMRAVRGSVLLLAPIHGNAGYDSGYDEYGAASSITMTAGQDVSIRRPLHLLGGRGSVELSAGRDIAIRGGIVGNGLEGSGNWGIGVRADAGRDIVIEPPMGAASLVFRLRGGFYQGEGAVEAGSGGSGELSAGRDIRIAEGVRIRANSGPSSGYPDNEPFGGTWNLDAGRDIRFDGQLFARGRGLFGESDGLEWSAGANLAIGPRAKIDLRSDYVGSLALTAPGRMKIEGILDARAHDFHDEDGFSGSGGSLQIDAGDIDFHGTFRTGGGEESGSVDIEACRLRLGGAGRIDTSFGAQDSSSNLFWIRIRESMSADAGSVLATSPEALPYISYRDPSKPPLLSGSVPANLTLQVLPLLEGCPVCGNLEVDEGESCDDGNVGGGDGCSADCRLEVE